MPLTAKDSISGRQRKAAFRDALSKGLSLDKALAFATKDDEPEGGKQDVDFKKVYASMASKFKMHMRMPPYDKSPTYAITKDDQGRDEGGRFTGTAVGKGGRELHKTSGHDSHEAAAVAALTAKPNAKSISTGHGYNGSFGIRFHRPDQVRSYKTTTDEDEPIEGALKVYESVKGLHEKLTEGFEAEHGGHSEGGHNAHGQAHGTAATPHGVVKPHAAPVAAVPHSSTPRVAPVATPKAPKATPSVIPPPTPKASPKQGISTAGKSGGQMKTHDAAKRFRIAVRDAVRENLPLSKIVELGVISGTTKTDNTPHSEGKEWKGVSKDQFRKTFADALAKGVPTKDAIRTALQPS